MRGRIQNSKGILNEITLENEKRESGSSEKCGELVDQHYQPHLCFTCLQGTS